MKRIERLTVEEYKEFEDLLSEDNLESFSGEILEEIPSNLFGIALDYGFNDTEVRDWIYKNAKELVIQVRENEIKEEFLNREVDPFKKCEWCAGTGRDIERLSIGAIEKCWDCQGTGLEGGLKAEELNSAYKKKITELIEENIDWDEVERLEKEYENEQK